MNRLRFTACTVYFVGIFAWAAPAAAQPLGRAMPSIREGIDESKLISLSHNTRPEATRENDRGQLAGDFPMDHVLLQMKRSPERETSLRSLIDQLHDSNSPLYHQWLTPEQFALSFGAAQEDVDAVAGWLRSRGFTIGGIQSSGMIIDFSGTALQCENAFHTEIHNLEVNGIRHIANMSDPRIPAALEPAIGGIVSLNNFHPAPQSVPRPQYSYSNPNGTDPGVVAGDIATIYNLTPAFAAGYSGKGQSIMVLEDTYLYSTGDWTIFR